MSISRCVCRVASSARTLSRGFGTLTAEQEAARNTAHNLRQARGIKERNAVDPLESAPWLKPRPAGAAREDWEVPYALFMGGGFAVIALAELYRPDRGPENWARDEAETRLQMRANDEEVLRLHNYAPGQINRRIEYEESVTLNTRAKSKSREEDE